MDYFGRWFVSCENGQVSVLLCLIVVILSCLHEPSFAQAPPADPPVVAEKAAGNVDAANDAPNDAGNDAPNDEANDEAELRPLEAWTLSSGHSIQARLLLATTNMVRLANLEGIEANLPIDRFHARDQQRILDHVAAEKAAALDALIIRGRFVRVARLGMQDYLEMAEVQVFSLGENIALKGTSSQSVAKNSALAIDGNTDGIYGHGSVTSVPNSREPWWEVDLGATHPIEAIQIWARTDDCCRTRLQTYTVTLLDADRNEVWRDSRKTFPKPMERFELLDEDVIAALGGADLEKALGIIDPLKDASIQLPDKDGIRTWTTTAGKTVDAKALKVVKGFVYFEAAAGEKFRLPTKHLSKPDLAFLEFARKGMKFQTVRIEMPNADQRLNIAELQVYLRGENIASKGVASYAEGVADDSLSRRVVDGNISGDRASNSILETKKLNTPWFELDLGTPVPAEKIGVWGRTDCCPERLRGYSIIVYGKDRKELWRRESNLMPSPVTWFSPSWGIEFDGAPMVVNDPKQGGEPKDENAMPMGGLIKSGIWTPMLGRPFRAKYISRRKGTVWLKKGRKEVEFNLRKFVRGDREAIYRLDPPKIQIPIIAASDRVNFHGKTVDFSDFYLRLYTPGKATRLEGMVIFIDEFGSDLSMQLIDTIEWQTLAQRYSLALVGCRINGSKALFDDPEIDVWPGEILMQTLDAVGEKSGINGLDSLPFSIYGKGSGADVGVRMLREYGTRVRSAVLENAAALPAKPSRSMGKSPTLWITTRGWKADDEVETLVNGIRSYGGKAIPLKIDGPFLKPADSQRIAVNFIEATFWSNPIGVAPVASELASKKIVPWNERFLNTPKVAWLPDREFAELWAEFHTP